ncbi:MAG: hypothetical protein RR382_00665 [Tannerellaceae bacterium]
MIYDEEEDTERDNVVKPTTAYRELKIATVITVVLLLLSAVVYCDSAVWRLFHAGLLTLSALYTGYKMAMVPIVRKYNK